MVLPDQLLDMNWYVPLKAPQCGDTFPTLSAGMHGRCVFWGLLATASTNMPFQVIPSLSQL